MHVHQTPSRLVVHHRPRLAVFTALMLWCLAAATGIVLNFLWPGNALGISLTPAALLFLTGLAVFFTEPRANLWIFDRKVQQIWVFRLGWLGAPQPEATLALHELEDALFPQTHGSGDTPQTRPSNGHATRLFDHAFRWESDRQRALGTVSTFLETSRPR